MMMMRVPRNIDNNARSGGSIFVFVSVIVLSAVMRGAWAQCNSNSGPGGSSSNAGGLFAVMQDMKNCPNGMSDCDKDTAAGALKSSCAGGGYFWLFGKFIEYYGGESQPDKCGTTNFGCYKSKVYVGGISETYRTKNYITKCSSTEFVGRFPRYTSLTSLGATRYLDMRITNLKTSSSDCLRTRDCSVCGNNCALWSTKSESGGVSAPTRTGYVYTYHRIEGAVTYYAPTISSITFSGGKTKTTISTSGGTTMTINGNWFGQTGSTADAYVYVGSSSCSVKTLTNTKITCTLPAKTGKNHIVMVYGGRSSSCKSPPSTSFMISYLAPTVSSVSPSTVSVTGGVITIGGANFGASKFSISVLVGGINCPVLATPTSHSSVKCTMPPGYGADHAIVVTVDGQASSEKKYVSYASPSVSTISPSSTIPVSGGTLTITGNNFFSGKTTVFIGKKSCTGVSVSSKTKLTCKVPAGAGADHTVTVIVGGQSTTASALFSYKSPFVSSISPSSTIPVSGGTLTISGSNFFSGQTTAFVGKRACTNVAVTGTTKVTCKVPAGAGADHTVTVIVGGQSTTASALFSYKPPTVSSFTPGSSLVTSGGTLTINGANFYSGATSVAVGSKACAVTSVTSTRITCSVTSGTGADHAISVNVAGQIATASRLFSYGVPAITSVTAPPSTNGGTITISGSNFGGAASVISVIIGAEAKCTSIVIAKAHTQIRCSAPAGFGDGYLVTVSVDGQTSAFASPLAYPAPSVSSISPNTGSTEGNFKVTLKGNNFGTLATVDRLVLEFVHATFKSAACKVTKIDSTGAECLAPSGIGSDWGMKLTVLPVGIEDGGISGSSIESTHAFSFSYSKPTCTEMSSLGPTSGGKSITLKGNDFGNDASLVDVEIGGVRCDDVAIVGPGVITCKSGAGMGSAKVTELRVASQEQESSRSAAQATYDPPEILAVTPTRATEGARVQLSGINFGNSPGKISISIGPNACSSPSILTSHYVASCTVPSGTRASGLDVRITVDGQQSKAGAVSFDLDNPCPLSKYVSPSDNFTCTSCPPNTERLDAPWTGSAPITDCVCKTGFYGTRGNACKACPSFSTTPGPGTLTVDGCTECVEGYYGPFQSVNGQCTRCPINMIQSTSIEEQCVCDPSACLGGDFVTLVNAGNWRQGCECKPCDRGYFCPSQATKMEKCGPGFQCPGIRSPAPQDCPKGTYSEGVVNEKCSNCPSFSTTSDEGASSRSDCACLNTHFNSASGGGVSCVQCAPGKYLQGKTCKNCANGKYKRFPGQAKEFCELCPQGKISEPSRASCVKCGSGTYSSEGDPKCTSCDSGWAASAGSSSCTQCGENTKVSADRSECENCPTGRFSPKESATCTTCEDWKCPSGRGTSGTVSGCGQCDICEPGKYSTENDALCIPCDAGTFSSARLSSSCEACGAGSVSSKGESSCTLCPAGKYKVGSDTCADCAPTYYSVKGSEQCAPCPLGENGEAMCTPQHQLDLKDGYWFPPEDLLNILSGNVTKRHKFFKCLSEQACLYDDSKKGGGAHLSVLSSFDINFPEADGAYVDKAKLAKVLEKIWASSTSQDGVKIEIVSFKKKAGGRRVLSTDSGTSTFTVEFRIVSSSASDAIDLSASVKDVFEDSSGISIVTANGTNVTGVLKGSPVVVLTGEIGCPAGYSGPLCAICDEGYVRSGEKCAPCSTDDWPPFLNTLVLLVCIGAFLGYLIWIIVFKKISNSTHVKFSVLRIALTTLQMLAAATLFKAHGSDLFRELMGTANSVAEGATLGYYQIDCVLGWGYYTKLIFTLLLPVISLFLPFIVLLPFALISKVLLRRKIDFAAFQRMYFACIVFLQFLIYQRVAEGVFSTFDCYDRLIGGKRSLMADFSIDCNSSKHTVYQVLSICVGICFSIGLPVLIIFGLRKREKTLLEANFFSKFGFMYRGYSVERKLYWWESVVMLRKLVIVCTPIVISNSYAQSITVLLALVVFIVLQMHFKPYVFPWLNWLEMLSLLDIYLVQVTCLLYLSSQDIGVVDSLFGAGSSDAAADNIGVTATLLVVQVFVFGTFAYFFVREYLRQRNDKKRGKSLGVKDSSNMYEVHKLTNQTESSTGAVELSTTITSMRFQDNPMGSSNKELNVPAFGV